MLSVLVHWSLVFLTVSFAVNTFAFVIHLNSWHLYASNPDSERLGYFVFLFILVCNLAFLVICKVPLLHRDWNSDAFVFGPEICQWTLVTDIVFSSVQFVVICFYLASVWLRLRQRASNLAEDQNVSSVKEGIVLVTFSLVVTVVIGVVVTYRLKLDNLSDGQKGLCHSSWKDSFWLSIFRWTLAIIGPFGLLALPAIIQLCRLRRIINSRLKTYLSLSVTILGIHCLLLLPSLIAEIHHWWTVYVGNGVYYYDPTARSSPMSTAFVTYILTKVLPDLQFLYVPCGVLVVLPASFSCSGRGRSLPVFSEASREKSSMSPLLSSSLPTNGVQNGRALRETQIKAIWGSRDTESSESANAFFSDIVSAEIHQRLSQSRTTVV